MEDNQNIANFPIKHSLLTALITTIGGFAVGYSTGFLSSTLQDLSELKDDRSFRRGSVESQLLGALLPVGGAIAAPFGGIMADHIGRKALLQVAIVPGLIGWALIFMAQYTKTGFIFKLFLLLGRGLTGIGIGMKLSVIQIYVAEMSSPNHRGFLGSVNVIQLMIGILLSYMMGVIPGSSYIHSALFMLVVLLIFEFLTIFLKESPRWLLMKNHTHEAKKSLYWLYQSEEAVEQMMEYIKKSLNQTNISLKTKLKMFTQKRVYLPLVLTVAITFFYEFTGNNVIISYAAQIFLTAKVKHPNETAIYSIGLVQLIAILVSAFLTDHIGRKKLLICGSIGIVVSNTALGTHLYLTYFEQCKFSVNSSNQTYGNEFYSGDNSDEECYTSLPVLPISSIILFSFFYGVGWRTVPYIMMGEMYPNEVRGILSGIGILFLSIMTSIVIGGYPSYEEAVQPYVAWWSFAGVAVLSIPFICILPETKGKTLEQIEKQFMRNKKKVEIKKISEHDLEFTQMKQDSIISSTNTLSEMTLIDQDNMPYLMLVTETEV